MNPEDLQNFKDKDYLIMAIISFIATFVIFNAILWMGSAYSSLLFGRELDKDTACSLAFAWTIKEWIYPGMMRATIIVTVIKIYKRLL